MKKREFDSALNPLGARPNLRASERRVYLRVREVLALAADYTPSEPETQAFFPKVQNKLHFAVRSADLRVEPGFHPKIGERGEVANVACNKDQPVHRGNRSELTVDERRSLTLLHQARPLARVPAGSRLVVGQHDEDSVEPIHEGIDGAAVPSGG